MALQLAQHKEADKLLSKDPLALLIGMVLDQQIPLEKAFTSPLVLQERLGHKPTADELAEFDTDKLVAIFSEVPALHRFPGSMAKRVQQMCQLLVDEFGGKADNVWKKAKSGKELLDNVKSLPGFGEQKAKIFIALLGKQLNVQPNGWEAVSTPFSGKDTFMSVADIRDTETLGKVRNYKKQMKAAAKAAATK